MSYLHITNPIKLPRGRAPRSRSSGIVVGCPGDVPGTSEGGSGVASRRKRTTACRAHRDLRGGNFKARGGGQRRPGSREKLSGRDPRPGQVRLGRGAGGWTHGPDPYENRSPFGTIFNVVHAGCARALVALNP